MVNRSYKAMEGAPNGRTLNGIQRNTKTQLLDYVRRKCPSPKHMIQKIQIKLGKGVFSIKISFLLVSHSELNTFETVLSSVKRGYSSTKLFFLTKFC